MKHKILVVEDDTHLAGNIKSKLIDTGFDATVVTSGNEGFKLGQLSEYSVIVLDVMLPGMNGFQVCTSLRKLSIDTPIIMLTSRDKVDDIVTGLHNGADDYLPKPFYYQELIARINKLIQRPPQAKDEVIVVGPLELHINTKSLFINQQIVPLKYREFDILLLLARNPNQTVPRQTINTRTATKIHGSIPTTVDVHISKIRSQLNKLGYRDIIETVHSVGYRLKIPNREV